jgi:hypothetical protein
MLYIISAVAMAFGLVYALSPQIMPYHETYLGMPHEQLPPKVAALLLLFMKGGGAAFFSLGIMLTMVVRIPFRQGETWAWWVILISSLVILLPLLFITLQLGTSTPWPVVVIMLILLLTALAISRPTRRS